MKKRFYIITTITLSATLLSLSSCLKDDSHFINFAGAGATIELPIEAYDGIGNLIPEANNISSKPSILPTIVNVASPKPLSTALNVTLALDPAALTAYNAANGTTYSILPPADYSVTNWTVTIPANQREATLNVSLNTSLIDPSQIFVLPINIASASGQKINQYNTVLYAIQVKNAYDGQYTVTGTLTDVVAPTITGAYPNTVNLITQSATTDAYYDTGNGYFHDILSGGVASVYGSFAPVFTFDPATNKITSVTNYYGQFSGSHVRSAELDPTGTNGFTSGTPGAAGSVFQVSYFLSQGNPAAVRTTFVETWTYVGGR
ncbi:MAG: DUF1735 domain-containing protein [Sphingobacteriales bacterium]